MTLIIPDDHVYESYEEKREALTALNDREYENQTPNLGRMSQRNEGYVEEFTVSSKIVFAI